MALHLPIETLKTRSGLEPIPRCEPSTYQRAWYVLLCLLDGAYKILAANRNK